LTKLVVREEPFQATVEPDRKPEPLIVRVKLGPPDVAEFGFKAEIAGVGALIVKLCVFDVVPSGFRTLTLALPCVAIRFAATYAVNLLPLT
jgi:hypothetical protein